MAASGEERGRDAEKKELKEGKRKRGGKKERKIKVNEREGKDGRGTERRRETKIVERKKRIERGAAR